MAESRQQGGKLKLFLEKTEVTIRIKWLDVEIDHLCVVFRKKKNPTFLFISLHSSEEKLRISHGVGTYRKIYVYGLQKTDHCQMFNVCSSSVVTLSEGASTMRVILPDGHDVQHTSITSILTNIDDNPKILKLVDGLGDQEFKLEVAADDSHVLQDVLIVIKFPEGDSRHEVFIYGAFDTSSIKIGKKFLPNETATAKMYILERAFLDINIMIYDIMMTFTEISFKPSPWSGFFSAAEQLKSPEMTIEELKELQEKATTFVQRNENMYKLTHLYRNKPSSYFDNILENDGIMKKYRKDYNGDPASCINGTIDGLFFSAYLLPDTKKPPHFSYFGDKRLFIPVEIILKENTKMYFADFYCLYECHYVTVVVTVEGSETDKFCKNKLLLLNPSDNSFITKCNNEVKVTLNASVEVFYTEDIDIASLMEENSSKVYFESASPRGDGKSKPYGIKKRKGCEKCSLERQNK